MKGETSSVSWIAQETWDQGCWKEPLGSLSEKKKKSVVPFYSFRRSNIHFLWFKIDVKRIQTDDSKVLLHLKNSANIVQHPKMPKIFYDIYNIQNQINKKTTKGI